MRAPDYRRGLRLERGIARESGHPVGYPGWRFREESNAPIRET
jgi:hypothetical protein